MSRPVRAVMLFAVAGLAAGVAPAQPPYPTPPTYTAFPNLTPPPDVAVKSGGKEERDADVAALYARLRVAADRPLAADATSTAKVQSHRLKAGIAFLADMHRRVRLNGGMFYGPDLPGFTRMAADTYRAAADGEPHPAARRALLEEQVRVLKWVEGSIAEGTREGRNPPGDIHFIRFHRLRAEGELLKMPEPK